MKRIEMRGSIKVWTGTSSLDLAGAIERLCVRHLSSALLCSLSHPPVNKEKQILNLDDPREEKVDPAPL